MNEQLAQIVLDAAMSQVATALSGHVLLEAAFGFIKGEIDSNFPAIYALAVANAKAAGL